MNPPDGTTGSTIPADLTDAEDDIAPPTIEVELVIDNLYPEVDETVVTTHTVHVPAPPRYDDESLEAWADDELSQFTGTGREDGDSFYTVTITQASDPRLTERVFEFG